jgi:uncharacterized protein YkwD
MGHLRQRAKRKPPVGCRVPTGPRTRAACTNQEAHVIETTVPRPMPARTSRRRRLAILVTAALATVTMLSVTAAPVSAGTAYDMEQQILSLMNQDRVARGLTPYRKWSALAALAGDRATRLASKNTLSHAAAGSNIGTSLNSRGIQWYGYGEAIGMTGYRWGSQAAAHLYSMWKNSPGHAALMYSANYNYVGIGVAYRSSNRTTWASILFTDSKDHTGAAAQKGTVGAQGTTISFSWSGYDPKLQKRTAGLRSFDLQYRVNAGSWRTIRDNTTATSITLTNRVRGRWYGFRVQAADQRGNLGKWTSEAKVWVP